ncbi:hypothetical protein BH10PLA2_BH10PLA2_11200 [soil metagenome]
MATQAGTPLLFEDPETHARYVILSLDWFEQMQRAMKHDTSEPTVRDCYPLFDRVLQADDAAMLRTGEPRPAQTLEDWTRVYECLSDEEIEDVDKSVKTRANLSRNLP